MSVITHFDPYTKTGNRMFQFAFGKLLSLEKGVTLHSQPIPGFANTYNYSIPFSNDNGFITTMEFGAHKVDFNILKTTNKNIVVNSYLQKHQYYTQHQSLLKNLFSVPNSVNVDKNELVIHIRGTDYRAGNVHIRDHIYLDILQRISPSKASIVTDDINTDIVKTLCKNGATVITQSNETNKGDGLNAHEMYDYLYMLKSNMLLISQSTFSWWAAFLGDQEKVIVPFDKQNEGMWKLSPGEDDIDLIFESDKIEKVIL